MNIDEVNNLYAHTGYWLRRLSDSVHLSYERALSMYALVPILTAIADQNDEKFFHILSTEEHIQLKSLLIKLLAPVGIDAARDWK